MATYRKYTKDNFAKIVNFENFNPYDIMGPHFIPEKKEYFINCYFPGSLEVTLKPSVQTRKDQVMKLMDNGFYQAYFKNVSEPFDYKFSVKYKEGYPLEYHDTYSFSSDVTDFDLYLLGTGNLNKSYENHGAKVKTKRGIKGVEFVVWAPNAQAVSVTGNFNHWTPGSFPMHNINGSGVWALFIPGLDEGEVYKYALKSWDGNVFFKSDPYAFMMELRPKTGSVVYDINKYEWKDSDWMETRENSDFQRSPISIYELHPGSFKRNYNNEEFKNDWGFLNYRQIAHEVVDYVKKTGYTHIELMPVMEHPLDQSWGYQVSNYFAPTSRFGTPDDFMYFVDYCHRNGIGVILDWVPAHFPSDEHGLANFDSSQLYAYKSMKKGYHMDWGTFVFDYGRNEVRNFLISNAIYWLDKYHIDGLRVDAVASMLYLDYSRNEGEWEPNIYGGRENLEAIEFLKQLNIRVHEYFKGIVMIAEESTAFPGVTLPVYLGGLGFDMKWNMGWMNDILAYFSKNPVHRKYHHNLITFSLWYAFSENFILPVSHDEVVHGKRSLYDKMPGDTWQKFANLRLFLAFMFGHPGKKLNFMGNDIAQYNEWNCDNMTDWFLLDYDYHNKVNLFMKDLNEMYKNFRALYEIDFKIEGFQWIDLSDSENSVISFMRKSLDGRQILIFTFNFTPVVRENYLFGVPYEGYYKEILNSDALEYGGSGTGNSGGIHTTKEKRFEWDNSIRVNLPPLGANVFLYESGIS
ncbi:MAG: 1,4-alpha-glucan branching protein GlgB [Ignavibacteria bacterium]|nr:1,4-alpha-glucan branching protein GlgB [Ignavibacteria bacterium]